MRAYELTHKWISFKVDLKNAPPSLWMNLGEAKSKCGHIANEPLRPSTAKILHGIYLAKGALATTAIEGNTLTEEEVRQHLEGKLKLPPSREYLAREIDNVISVCNKIKENLISDEGASIGITTIKQFNHLLLANLALDEGVIPGEIRDYSVTVGSYRGAPPEDCEFLLIKLCEWLDSSDFIGDDSQSIVYAILKAVIAHIYLAWIHPFGDGNGRTARIIEFQILLAAGVPTPAAHLLSNHYNQTRQEYYRQLDRASKSGGDIIPFICYSVQGFVDGLREQLEYIKAQQLDIVWRNFVHETFHNDDRASSKRQRILALDLGRQPEPVPLKKIPQLTPELARIYAKKTERTIRRDISDLETIHRIVEKNEKGIRAKRELVLSFLPPVIKTKSKDQMLLL